MAAAEEAGDRAEAEEAVGSREIGRWAMNEEDEIRPELESKIH